MKWLETDFGGTCRNMHEICDVVFAIGQGKKQYEGVKVLFAAHSEYFE